MSCLSSVAAPAVLSPEMAEARAELIERVVRAQRGDLEAQSELVRKYMRRIASYVKPLVGQPSAVEDVVQVVFIKMVRQLHLLREPGFFETWLYTLSRNTAFDAVRHRHRRIATVSAEEELLRLPESTNEFAMSEILDTVDSALTLLRPKDRRLLDHILQGDSYRRCRGQRRTDPSGREGPHQSGSGSAAKEGQRLHSDPSLATIGYELENASRGVMAVSAILSQ